MTYANGNKLHNTDEFLAKQLIKKFDVKYNTLLPATKEIKSQLVKSRRVLRSGYMLFFCLEKTTLFQKIYNFLLSKNQVQDYSIFYMKIDEKQMQEFENII